MTEREGEQTSVLDVYERHGAAWAELRTDHLIEESWLDRFCDRLVPGAAVLDIGCGAGLSPMGLGFAQRSAALKPCPSARFDRARHLMTVEI